MFYVPSSPLVLEMVEEHRTDHEHIRNLSRCFQSCPKSLLRTQSWELLRELLNGPIGNMFSPEIQITAESLNFVHTSQDIFVIAVHISVQFIYMNENIWHVRQFSNPTHHQQVIVPTIAPEALETFAPRHEVQNTS
jgi:hypothetical protein